MSIMASQITSDSSVYSIFCLNWQPKSTKARLTALRWRHNDHGSVSNHQPHSCLLNRLFRRKSKKTSKFRVTGLCVGNSPGPVNSPHKGPVTRKMFPFDDVIMRPFVRETTGGFPSQMASNVECVSIAWRHHSYLRYWIERVKMH